MATIPDDSSNAAPVAPAAPSSSKGAASGTSSGISPGLNPAPPGHAFRRTKTMDESIPLRRRPTATRSEASSEALPRRSSNFSEYSLGEARDILYPRAQGAEASSPESSSLASLSLAFALLPALAGVLFRNGSSVVTDVMLLGLAGVFLHWSVTQPWTWYHAAQEVRVQHEANAEAIIDDDSDIEPQPAGPNASVPLDDVPEEDEPAKPAMKEQNGKTPEEQMTSQQQQALGELYTYEVLALMACFMLPLMSAYLLHAIRSQLSRPSEGLVSNYNLTIFLLVSELRVVSHMFKLVQSRTLHLQRIVHGNPFASGGGSGAQMEDMLERMERLESRTFADEMMEEPGTNTNSTKAKQEAVMTREVRNAIQPELDALNRAVRRYEKKATLLQLQTESRFANVDARLDDAIALAAVAAKNSASGKNLFKRTLESLITIVLFPFNAILQILVLPLKALLVLIGGNKQKAPSAKSGRGGRPGKTPAQGRYSGERVSSRVSKR